MKKFIVNLFFVGDSLKYYVYIALSGEDVILDYVRETRSNLSLLSHYEYLVIIKPSVCLMLAEKIKKSANKAYLSRIGLLDRVFISKFKDVVRPLRYPLLVVLKLSKIISKDMAKHIRWSYVKLNDKENAVLFQNQNHHFDSSIFTMLSGRVMLESELISFFTSNGITNPDEIEAGISYLLKKTKHVQAVTHNVLGYICNRCGNESNFKMVYCRLCHENMVVCIDCESMGISSSCQILFFFELEPIKSSASSNFNCSHEIDSQVKMTKAQKEVSAAILKWTRSDKNNKHALVWAACGAGKTEVVYESINNAITKGKRVIYAVPRRDVVIELFERLRKVFCEFSLEAVYGGNPSDLLNHDITICTTHQALRYYKAFDLCILDEADAFPFKGSRMLDYALNRAIKDEAKVINMTATPTKDMHDSVKKGQLECFVLPIRHHGQPVPLPKLIKSTFSVSKNRYDKILPKEILVLFEESIKIGRTLFVFVPFRYQSQIVCEIIKDSLNHMERINIEWSHSKDESRGSKFELFKQKKIDIFVTTSILERGITIDNADVIVLFADSSSVFLKSGLIQMAGRAGRTFENPNGNVWFVFKNKTKEIEGAIIDINALNENAKKNGFLICR